MSNACVTGGRPHARAHARTHGSPRGRRKSPLNVSPGRDLSSSGVLRACEVVLPPRVGRAHALPSPPLVHVFVILGRTVVVQHRAHPAPEVRVDELAGPLPAEVRVVQLVVAVQPMQILGELLRRLELVHVDVGTVWRAVRVIRRMGAHHDRQDVVPESINEELLRDVVFAVGILEREIEFVVLVEHVEARLRLRARAAQAAARTVNVHLDVFREFPGIMHALISGMAVGNEPSDLLRFVCCIIKRL